MWCQYFPMSTLLNSSGRRSHEVLIFGRAASSDSPGMVRRRLETSCTMLFFRIPRDSSVGLESAIAFSKNHHRSSCSVPLAHCGAINAYSTLSVPDTWLPSSKLTAEIMEHGHRESFQDKGCWQRKGRVRHVWSVRSVSTKKRDGVGALVPQAALCLVVLLVSNSSTQTTSLQTRRTPSPRSSSQSSSVQPQQIAGKKRTSPSCSDYHVTI